MTDRTADVDHGRPLYGATGRLATMRFRQRRTAPTIDDRVSRDSMTNGAAETVQVQGLQGEPAL